MRHKQHIDIFLHVIDNMGDMGFACELLAGFERTYPWFFSFDIWTDALSKVDAFFVLNSRYLWEYQVRNLHTFGEQNISKLAISLFHAPIPDIRYFTKWSLVLRIDYLSFDPTWTIYTLTQHITSTSDCRILEIIPSPLSTGSGLISTYPSTYSRQELAKTYTLDLAKEWILIFVYQQTFDTSLILDNIPGWYEVIVFGATNHKQKEGYIYIPWVDIATWHNFIDTSIWCIIRGEVSAVAALSRNKLAFWDMYKQLWGFHHEQSEDFLKFIYADSRYRDIHLRLNQQKNIPILLSQLIEYQESLPNSWNKSLVNTQNLIEEIKKCIDSHEFSI